MNWIHGHLQFARNRTVYSLVILALLLAALSVWLILTSGQANARPQSVPDSTGSYTATTSVNSDPAGHSSFVNLGSSQSLMVTVSGGSFSISSTAGQNWVNVSGSIDGSGNFVASGTGTVAGFANVACVLTGSINGSGALTAVYEMGTNGELNGQSIKYNVNLTIPAAPEPTATPAPTATPTPTAHRYPAPRPHRCRLEHPDPHRLPDRPPPRYLKGRRSTQ